MNSGNINITIKEYIPNISNDGIKLSIEIFSNHFLPDIKPHTIFYGNKTINDENKYNEIVKIIESNIEIIKKLNLENISSFKGGLQQQITIKLENNSYLVIGNTDNQEMKQLYIDLKEKILKIINQNDRSDYFTHKQGDIQFGDSQCDFCKYNDLNNKGMCVKYPSGKPNDIINSEIKCDYLEIKEKKNDVKNLFEKDSNGAYIRLIIPSEFVCLILPEYKGNMDLIGKKDLDLTSDEVIVLKKYAYELSEKNKNVTN